MRQDTITTSFPFPSPEAPASFEEALGTKLLGSRLVALANLAAAAHMKRIAEQSAQAWNEAGPFSFERQSAVNS